MTGRELALDTNAVIAFQKSYDFLLEHYRNYSDFILPVPVLAELTFGAIKSTRSHENLKGISRLTTQCKVIGIGSKTADVYAHIRLELQKIGRPIPENDIWIAAICIEHQVPLATEDAHFSYIPPLRIVSI